MTASSLNPEQPPPGPLEAAVSASTPESGAWEGRGAQAGSQGPSGASLAPGFIDEPLDIDRHWPRPPGREDALQRLTALVAGREAEAIWRELIGPLYDARRFASEWPRGSCRRCHIVHPDYPSPGAKIINGKHRMRCPKYVGPLEHRIANSFLTAFGGIRNECICGASYTAEAATCPDAELDWRGPRPAGAADA